MNLLAQIYLPPASSTHAAGIDFLFNFIFWMSVVFFIIITTGTLAFAWLYRQRGRATGPTPSMRHNTTVEIVWTVIPTLLILFIFAVGFRQYLRLWVAPRYAMEVNVTAFQWGWTFTYPDGLEATELVVPAGKPVKLIMNSKDVIHSLFIPDFRVKMDVLPNRYTTMWFEAMAVGTHDLYCTEYCGLSHAKMNTLVRVVSEADYAKWVQDQQMPADAAPDFIGKRLYRTKQCHTCHSVDGSAVIGPSFKGLYGRQAVYLENGQEVAYTADDNYIRASIIEPNAQVVKGYPNVMNRFQLTEEEIRALIAYIRTLSDQPAAPLPVGGEGAAPAPPGTSPAP